jgi:hypothetical protein
VWCFVSNILSFCPYVVLYWPQIVLLSLCGAHHTGTKEQSMANKEPHRDKRTIYGRQSTTQGQKDNLWQTKHHTGTKGQAIDFPFVPVWCFVGHSLSFCPCVVLFRPYIVLLSLSAVLSGQKDNIWQTKHHTGTKEQSMADKEPHRDKRTIYGRQSTTQGQKNNIWQTKHHIGTKEQSMADKAPHRVCWFVGHKLSFCPCVVLCRP